MNAKEFIENYYMHDSWIENVEVLDGGTKLLFTVGFAFWMQEGYKESDPETGIINVIFDGVKKYEAPENIVWENYGILDTFLTETDGVKFAMGSDIFDDPLPYFEAIVEAEDITVTVPENPETEE